MRIKNKKEAKALFVAPLLFAVVGYTLLYFFLSPLLTPLFQVYAMITSNQSTALSEEILYDGSNLLENNTLHVSEILYPNLGDLYGELSIERLNVERSVYYGDSSAILAKGIGTYASSFLPGWERPILLAGHNVPQFQFLGKVVVGDKIQFRTHYGTFHYEITGTRIARADDASAYDLGKNEEELIMYTCYPIDALGFKLHRLFVYAKKIDGPQIEGVN
ncbi:MAG: class D sortase [Erysipelotrichaceae bacterium]